LTRPAPGLWLALDLVRRPSPEATRHEELIAPLHEIGAGMRARKGRRTVGEELSWVGPCGAYVAVSSGDPFVQIKLPVLAPSPVDRGGVRTRL